MWWHTPVIPATQESTNGSVVVRAGLGIKGDPISKIINTKMTEDVDQVVESLPHKCEALRSKPRTAKGYFFK
jgi:hypothetical protein